MPDVKSTPDVKEHIVLMKNRAVAALAGLALAGGACLAAGVPVAHAATPKCASNCVSLFNQKFGDADVSAATGSTITLAKAAAVPAQDWAIFNLGAVRAFYRAGLLNGTLNASYGLDDVYEFEYVPAKSFTDLCLAVVPGSTTVTLQACGRTARTIWIADQAAANGAYAPLISGTDTASPAALALTATKVGAAFTVTPLTKKGAAATDQMWQTISGVLPA
jgi:hypothetical protein